MDRVILYDTTTQRRKLGGTPLSQPVDQSFDIGVGGATEVTVSSGTITPTGKIDVFVNGAMAREGVGNAWTRDTANNKILFNYTVQQNAWVLVRLW